MVNLPNVKKRIRELDKEQISSFIDDTTGVISRMKNINEINAIIECCQKRIEKIKNNP